VIQAALVIIGAGTIVRASLRRHYRAGRTMRVAWSRRSARHYFRWLLSTER